MEIIKSYPSEYRYGQKICCTIKSNGETKWYSLIMLTNLQTMESFVSEFSDYLFKNDEIIACSINTRKNNYGGVCVSFLNYIFFDRKKPLESIESISKEIGVEFLNKYSLGETSDRKNMYGYTISQAPETVKRAKQYLTYFYNWLNDAKSNIRVNGKLVKKYNLKYISDDDFKWYEKRTQIGSRKSLEVVFEGVETFLKETKLKMKNPSDLVVYLLIELARHYDPMIAFAIALQAFVGLRRGEVCQMWRKRLHFKKPAGVLLGLYVDLRKDKFLRDDGVDTGQIKRKRCQLAYPAFLQYVYKIYNEHMEFLKHNGLDADTYGALFFDDNGKAMTTKTYAERFDKLIPRLIKRLGEMKNHKSYTALQAAFDFDTLINSRMTPHSLRAFFTEYITKNEKSSHIVAMFRGDTTLNVALVYLRQAEANRDEMRKIQDSFAATFEELMGRKPTI